MLYYIVATLLLLHTMFWGVGLSWLVLPRRWGPVWWIFTPVFGFALQSAVVWAGAQSPLPGTDSYALWSELLPLGLLALAWKKLGRAGVRRKFASATRAAPVAALLVTVGGLLLWPMAQRGAWTLTSSSLGSCDHADYAAGARVFREFARDSDEGFLGLSEVTSVGSAGSFFEFWLKLNHFTPSALIAHEGTVFQLAPFQLVSVSGVVVLLASIPLVLLLARATGLVGWQRTAMAALYGLSPLSAYAVHQGALGQLYAAHGIAVLTLAMMAGVEPSPRKREIWRLGAVLVAGIWLLAGCYNFILTVALAPSAAWLIARALRNRSLRECGPACGALAAAFAICVLLFWGRFAGVIERFQLFDEFDFGWPVPPLWPSAWLGGVTDSTLHGFPNRWAAMVSALALLGWVAGVIGLARRDASRALAAAAFVAPVAAGWALLFWESRTRANASYDAFKIVSVFLPCLLCGLCVWLAALPARFRHVGTVALGMMLVANVAAASHFVVAMSHPPLRVDRALLDLRRLESLARFPSFNMRVENFWSRLWANDFLLRKPHYFVTHTYEGRRNTALKGEWDLSDSLLHSVPRRPTDYFRVNEQFHLERVGAAGRVQLDYGAGWHALEGNGATRWRWTAAVAEVVVTNSDPRAVRATLRLRCRSTGENTLVVSLGDTELGRQAVSAEFRDVEIRDLTLPPGSSILHFRVERPAETVAGDARMLGIALAHLAVVANAGISRPDAR